MTRIPTPSSTDPAGPLTPLAPLPATQEPGDAFGVEAFRRSIQAGQKADAEAWGTTMRAAIASNPNVAAEADKLARVIGKPLDAAKMDLGFLRALSTVEQMRQEDIRSTSPILYKSLQGLDFARKAWADWGHLSSFERWGAAWNRGELAVERGRVATRLALGGDPEAVKKLDEINLKMGALPPSEGLGHAAEMLGQRSQTIPRALAVGGATAAGAAAINAGLAAVAPPVAAASPFSAAGGFWVGFTSTMAMDAMQTEGGNAYADMVGAGYDPNRALPAAIGVGMVNAALEVFGARLATGALRSEIGKRVFRQAATEVAKDIPSGAVVGFLKAYVQGIGGEVATESFQELVTIIGEELAAKGGEQNLSPDGIASRLWEVASKTVQGMAVLGVPNALSGAARAKAMQDMRRMVQEQIQRGGAIADQSALVKNDPQAAAEFFGQVLNQRQVHVDAETFRDVLAKIDAESAAKGELRKSTLDILEGIVPGVAQQLEDSLNAGGDVSLPLADILSRVRAEAPEFAKALEPHMRLDPDEPATSADAATEEQAAKADTGTEKEAEFYRLLRDIRRQTAEQVQAAGGTELGRQQSDLVAGIYTAAIEQIARNEKLEPSAVVEKYGATFEKVGQQAPARSDALSQPNQFANGARKTDTPEFKAWFGESKVVDESGKPLVVYHGTTASYGFTEFDGGQQGKTDSGWLGRGFYFSTNQDTARWYAGAMSPSESTTSEGAWDTAASRRQRVGAFFLAVQNPLVVRPEGQGWIKQAEVRKALGLPRTATPEDVTTALRERGHDGVVLNYSATGGLGNEREVMVLDPTQIKSVNNRGTFDPNDPNILRQNARGYFSPQRLAVILSEAADVSTAVHELTHWYVEIVDRLDRAGSAYGKQQFGVLLERWGVTREQWDAMDLDARRPMLEDISYNAEEYFATGQAPSEELRGVFQKLRSFIVGLYRTVRDQLVRGYAEETGGKVLPPLDAKVRGFFDRMLASEQAIELELATREGAASLSAEAAKAVGISEEDLAEIKAIEAQRTEDAKADLTAEVLRGARFFAAGRRNAEAALKRQLEEKRAKVRAEVEAEVRGSGAHAAARWLRDGQFFDGTEYQTDPSSRRLNTSMVRRILGLPPLRASKPVSMVARIRQLGGIRMETYPGETKGEFNIPGVFVREGGQSWEAIAQALASEGYGGERYNAETTTNVSNEWLVDALTAATKGEKRYPAEFVSESEQMLQEHEAWLKSQNADADEAVRAQRSERAQAERAFRSLAVRRLLQSSKEQQTLDAYAEARRKVNGRKLSAEEMRAIRERVAAEYEEGSDPDVVGGMFGFPSGAAMLRAIVDAPPLAEMIDQQTEARIQAEEPLADPKKFKAAVAEALAGKTSQRLAATILRAMLKVTGASVTGLEKQAREAARVALLRTPVGRITVRGFAQAEARAVRARDKALKSGDVNAAIEAQRQLLVQHYLTVEAAKVEREVDRAVRTIGDRYGKGDDEIVKGRRNLDVVQAARVILGKFGLFPAKRAEAALAHLQSLDRIDPDAAAPLKQRIGMETEDATDWTRLSLDRFRVLAATADGMWSSAHRTAQVKIAGKLVDREAVQQELLDGMIQVLGGGTEKGLTMARDMTPPSELSFGSIVASMTRLEAWTKMMDGGKLGGPWQRLLYQPLKDGLVARDLELEASTEFVKQALEKWGDLTGPKIDLQQFLGQGTTAVFENKAALIGAILQMGTESGFRNLILGNRLGTQAGGVLVTGWAKALEHLAATGVLTKNDFDVAQQVWDWIASNLRDRVFGTTRDLWGFIPQEEKATPFDTPFGRYPGGYFPSKVDKSHPLSRVGKMQQVSSLKSGQRDFMAAHTSVPRGMTISRKDNVVEPRVTDVRLLQDHIADALNIIHLQPAISDVAGLFGGRENHLAAALDTTLPFASRRIILPALERMARDSIQAPTDPVIAGIANFFKQTASAWFLGFNPRNAAQQVTGLLNAVPEVGLSRIGTGVVEMIRNSGKMEARIEQASKDMRARWSTKMQLMAQDIERMLEPSKLRDFQRQATMAAFLLQRYMQRKTDAIVWSAAYEKAIAEGKDHDTAVRNADQVVRLTQGEKSTLDVPRMLSGNAIAQLLTQFADYPNTVLNQNIAAPVGRRFATIAWTMIAPTLASSMIALAFAFGRVGKGDVGDDDYAERLAKHFAGDQVRGAFGAIPVFGGLASGAINAALGLSNDGGTLRNQPAAAWSIVESLQQVAAGQAKLSTALGIALAAARIPARPVVNLVGYQERVESGREEQGDILDYLRVLLNGR